MCPGARRGRRRSSRASSSFARRSSEADRELQTDAVKKAIDPEVQPYVEIQTPEGVEDELVTEELILNLGPQHPSTHGVLRLILRLHGERIVECVPVLGYLHRGLEKIYENRTYEGGIRYADQADYVAVMLNEWAYALAAEACGDLEVPRRAEFLRTIVGELSRACAHLIWLGTYLLDVGATTPFLWCLRDREQILDMFEEICGSRFNHNYYRPGGLLYDFPPGLLGKLQRFLDRWEKNIEEYRELIEGNEIFLERTVGVGVFDTATAIQYGIGGPMLRATGLPHDLRVDRPYSIYPELKSMRPVTAQDGDAFARYQVRLGELKLVIALVRECIDKLPGGAVRSRVGHVWKAKPNEVYVPIEGAKGEIGYYMISKGGPNPFRAKMRGASFCNLQLLPLLLRGRLVADAVAILGSIDIVLGEVDR